MNNNNTTTAVSLSWAEIAALVIKGAILLPSGALQTIKLFANYGMRFEVVRDLVDDSIKEVWLWDGKAGKRIIIWTRNTITFEKSDDKATLTKTETDALMEEARVLADNAGDHQSMWRVYGQLVTAAIDAKSTVK